MSRHTEHAARELAFDDPSFHPRPSFDFAQDATAFQSFPDGGEIDFDFATALR